MNSRPKDPSNAALVDAPSAGAEPSLEREVSLTMLVLYGLGTTIGAGIYALTGEVAGRAGMQAPLAFLLAAMLAGVTGLGFAELAGRMPKAAGEAVFVSHAFGRPRLTGAVGLAVVAAGLVAAAAISVAFGGYMSELVDIPEWILVCGLVGGLGIVAASGAKESVNAAAVFTVVEMVGLVLVVWAGRHALVGAGGRIDDLLGGAGGGSWTGVVGGAFLAFFAFLGFEDIDAVAEETRDAERTLPRAILITLAITTVFYVLVSTTSVLVVEPGRLARSDAPLSLVYEQAGGRAQLLSVIAGLAMINGVLVQLVMIPRVVYGLSRLRLLPTWAGAVSPRTHTPVRATVAGIAVVSVLALTLDLGPLARLTSATTMGVFVMVNIALVVIKRRDGPTSTFQVPSWLPWLGLVASSGMFATELWSIVGA